MEAGGFGRSNTFSSCFWVDEKELTLQQKVSSCRDPLENVVRHFRKQAEPVTSKK